MVAYVLASERCQNVVNRHKGQSSPKRKTKTMNTTTEKTDYQAKARIFLAARDLQMKFTKGNKIAPWGGDEPKPRQHYVVTITRGATKERIRFDFWGSLHDYEQGNDITPYDVLACISSDLYCPEKHEDFAANTGTTLTAARRIRHSAAPMLLGVN